MALLYKIYETSSLFSFKNLNHAYRTLQSIKNTFSQKKWKYYFCLKAEAKGWGGGKIHLEASYPSPKVAIRKKKCSSLSKVGSRWEKKRPLLYKSNSLHSPKIQIREGSIPHFQYQKWQSITQSQQGYVSERPRPDKEQISCSDYKCTEVETGSHRTWFSWTETAEKRYQ